MFKRLRERLVEEANKLPVAQAFGNNPGKPPDANINTVGALKGIAGDFVISESSSVIVPRSTSDNFSIADEDGFLSDQNSPHKKMTMSELQSSATASGNESATDFVFHSDMLPSQSSSFLPNTDVESEMEDPPTLNLEDISKEQLLDAISTLKAKVCKYKNKYSEAIKVYKSINDEKKKLEHTLTKNQDRSLRRMAELREQYQLEQKAKADLESNLRMDLDEKESKISALKTQIILLKGQSDNHSLEGIKQYVTSSCMTDVKGLSSVAESCTIEEYEAKLISDAEKMDKMAKENLVTTQKLNTLAEAFERKERMLISDHEMTVMRMRAHLEELTQQQESSDMSMAEMKQNMHKELEIREDQLKKLKEETHELRERVHQKTMLNNEMKMQHDSRVSELQMQLKAMEEDKQSHMFVSRKKSDAVGLMQQEYERKLATLEGEWKKKFEEVQQHKQDISIIEKQKYEEKFVAVEAEWKEKLEEVQRQLEIAIEERKEYEKKLGTLEGEWQKKFEEAQQQQDISVTEEQEYEKKFIAVEAEWKEKLEEVQRQREIAIEEKQEYEKKLAALECEWNKKLQETQLQQETAIEEKQEYEKKLAALECEWNKKLQETQLQQETAIEEKQEYEKKLAALECEWNKKLEKTQLQQETAIEAKEKVITKLSKCSNYIQEKYEQQMKDDEYKISQLKKLIKLLKDASKHYVSELECTKLKLGAELRELQKALLENTTEVYLEMYNHIQEVKVLDESFILLKDGHAHELEILNDIIKDLEKARDQFKAEANERAEMCNSSCRIAIEKLKFNISQLEVQNEEMLKYEMKFAEVEKERKKKLEEAQAIAIRQQQEYEKKLAALECEWYKKLEEMQLQQETAIEEKEDLSKQLTLLHTENEDLKSSLKGYDYEKILMENQSLKNRIELSESEVKNCSEKCSLNESAFIEQQEDETKFMQQENSQSVFNGNLELTSPMYDAMQCSDAKAEMEDMVNRLNRESRLKFEALKSEIWKKDSALNDIREHYELIIQEKDKKIKELDLCNMFAEADVHAVGSEPSDWDDAWFVPDKAFEDTTSISNDEAKCNQHVKQIETMQEELNKCNSEIKDLKNLLHLTRPLSLETNSNICTTGELVPEPTEIEYLKNVLFKYMMGEQTKTLVKVISAVLKFSDEEKRMLIENEEAKPIPK